ncbi:DUF1707 domain-containing protein [Brevibacterium sp.]|uniref:DUF1707 domain-containing protein n=1 Tax=Brevibacterium sp. TaxID=1701 RepID=UPI0025BF06CF|nr:DUF1707 domain-containing protein [Brevibacterium sp.]
MLSPRAADRPSTVQREEYRTVLAEGFAVGRLDRAEFDRRLSLAAEAATLQDLERLIADLPCGEVPVPVRPAAGAERSAQASGPPRWKVACGIAAVAGAVPGVFLAAANGYLAEDYATRAVERAELDEAGLLGTLAANYPDAELDAETIRTGLAAFEEQGEAASEIVIRAAHVAGEIPVGGNRFDNVSIRPDGSSATWPGGTYRPEDGERLQFDVIALDADLIARMLEVAPVVFAEETGQVPEAAYVKVSASFRSDAVLGTDPDSPRVMVAMHGPESGRGGGWVSWTADGQTLPEVFAP